MTDIAKRFPENPLLKPFDVKPSAEGLQVACLLNPGAFRFYDKTWLLVRVAERPVQPDHAVSFPVISATGEIEIIEISLTDPALVSSDPRVLRYNNINYLTTLSHLRLFCSDDGVKFYEPEGYPLLTGLGRSETFGIEDCRVAQIGDTYHLSFTAVSANGVGVGLRKTTDWKNFTNHGMIFPPHNKDCAIFNEKINGKYYALHRPTTPDQMNNIWIAESPDGIHWGNHRFLAGVRDNGWENARVGAGAAPIKTEKGWLEIYHAANGEHHYALGALLLDINDPGEVVARTADPIMVPRENYELTGFFGHVIFTNGHIVEDDTITIYYGAADEFVCGAKFSVPEIFEAFSYDRK